MVDKSRRGGKERRRKADAESPPGKGGFCEGWTAVGLGGWRRFGVSVRYVRPVVFVGHHSIFSHLFFTALRSVERKRKHPQTCGGDALLMPSPAIVLTCSLQRYFSGLQKYYA